jgi:hypothetical protein
VVSQLDRGVLHQPAEAVLGADVVSGAVARLVLMHAGDCHDAAAPPALDQPAGRPLDAKERAVEVEIHRLAPGLPGQLQQRAARSAAGIVDKGPQLTTEGVRKLIDDVHRLG